MNSEASKVRKIPYYFISSGYGVWQTDVVFPSPQSNRLSFQSNLPNVHSFLITCAANISLVPFLCQTPLHTKNISENVADNPLVVKLEKECHEWNPGSGHKWDSHRKLRKTSPEAGKWCSRRRHNHQGERSKNIRRRTLNGFVFHFFSQ